MRGEEREVDCGYAFDRVGRKDARKPAGRQGQDRYEHVKITGRPDRLTR